MQVLTRPLTMRNISKLPLSFSLKAAPPFSVDRALWQLGLGEGGTVNVCCDPDFKHDLASQVIIY
jgi:hydrocephalus-inducing protein